MTVAPAVPAVEAAPRPESPYVGLVPYGEDDAEFFFGRSTEAAIVGANLRAARLTIVYGPSGVGKSSLLMAGVVHGLREDARAADEESAFAVCVYRSWHDEPVLGLEAAARAALQELVGDGALPPSAATLAETLRAWTDRTGKLLLVLDQFEEYFQYRAAESDERGLTGFAAELARIANDPTLDVHVLLSIREDAWAKLDLFKGRIPSLFGNYLRVDHLDLDAAREAIERPIAAWNRSLPPGSEPYAIEPELSEAVLEAAAGGGLTLSGGEAPAVQESSGDRVEAPFLQLVLERLWRATVADGAHTLTLARLEALGGARRIVENHLLEALARLTEAEQDVAADCFRFLVSRSKTKIAHPAADLAEWTGRPEPQVMPVLDKLCTGESGRILRAVAPADDEGSTAYELFHDVLAEPILAWRRSHEAERNRRATRRRVIRWGSVLVALLAVFAALAISALVQRNHARSATTSAGALAAAANANDPSTPLDLSLLLSLAAYQTKPNLAERSSALAALEAAQRSGVVRVFRGHTESVFGVAFSPDGRILASAGGDGTVRLWDARGRAQPAVLHGGAGPVNAVAFSHDGRILASGGADGTVRLWDLHAHRQLGALTGNTSSVNAVAFSPDGRILASAGADGTIRLWDVYGRRQLGVIRGGAGPVNAVAFNPDGHTLASAADGSKHGSGVVRLWDVQSRRSLGRRMLHENGYRALSVAFSPDGNMLASAGGDGTVRLWHVPSGKQAVMQDASRTAMYSVAFSPDGRTLASSSADGTIWLWKAGTLESRGTLESQQGDIYDIAFSPDGVTLASAGADHTVRVWNLRGQPKLAQGGDVTGIAFSPDGHTLASGGEGGKQTVRLWDVHSRQPSGRLDHGTGDVDSIAVSHEGLLATGGKDGTIRLWDVRSGQLLRQRKSGSEEVRGLAFSRDGRMLASANADDTIQTWDVRTLHPTGKLLHGPTTWDYVTNSVAFSPDGHMLASGGDDYTVRLWDVRTRRGVGRLRGDTSWMAGVAFSPDGRTLASADWDGTVRLWDVRTRTQLGEPLRGHTAPVEAVAFSPDGSTLASGGDDSTVRLWDVPSHRQLGQPLRVGSGSVVNSVAFSPDGRTLASAADDGTIRLWENILWRNFADLRAQVCRLVVGNLTKAESAQYAPGLPYHTTCPS